MMDNTSSAPNARNPLWNSLISLTNSENTGDRSADSTMTRLPLMAPRDRGATTVRMMLSSAESTIQTFSTRVDALLKDVSQATHHISQTEALVHNAVGNANEITTELGEVG